MRIEAVNISQVQKMLWMHNIEYTIDNDHILINETDVALVNKLLKSLTPKPPKSKNKRLDFQDKQRSGPKTKASKGERRHVKRNISLIPHNNDYVLSQQKKGELITHTINRIIEEHRQYNEKV